MEAPKKVRMYLPKCVAEEESVAIRCNQHTVHTHGWKGGLPFMQSVPFPPHETMDCARQGAWRGPPARGVRVCSLPPPPPPPSLCGTALQQRLRTDACFNGGEGRTLSSSCSLPPRRLCVLCATVRLCLLTVATASPRARTADRQTTRRKKRRCDVNNSLHVRSFSSFWSTVVAALVDQGMSPRAPPADDLASGSA